VKKSIRDMLEVPRTYQIYHRGIPLDIIYKEEYSVLSEIGKSEYFLILPY